MAAMKINVLIPAAATLAFAYGAYCLYIGGNQVYGLLLIALALVCLWQTSANVRSWYYGLNDPLY